MRIALVGDRSEAVVAHRAIPLALELASKALGREIEGVWVPTDRIPQTLDGFAGVWCTPGSPYASMAGALEMIRRARVQAVPFLGTCGGFQHALIEYARNVLGVAAEHAESSPGSPNAIITLLACALVNEGAKVRLAPGSKLAAAYQANESTEEYQCRYGLDPGWRARLEAGGVVFTGFDEAGDVRALELTGHPFFVGALFQPERAALKGFAAANVADPTAVPSGRPDEQRSPTQQQGTLSPIVRAFLEAARSQA